MANALLKKGSIMLGLLSLMLMIVLPAGAFQPVSQSEYEILLPAWDQFGHASYDRDAGSFAVTNSLENRYGGEWRVHSWNAQTGTPHFVYGTAAKVANGFSSRAGVESVARQVIADNMSILRATQTDLRLTETPHALGKWAAHFQQTYQGLDVWNSKVRLVFSDAGDLMLMG
ncbi:MAG: hypothetical protein GY835_04085, partial [bacterium]|nr:hypothetical protein [bacterium]